MPEASAKRARTMSDVSSRDTPNRITEPLGGDETYCMKDLFQTWGLPTRFHENMSQAWRCKLVPMTSDSATQRTLTCEGVPFLAPVELAQGVFDAMRSDAVAQSETHGGGGDDACVDFVPKEVPGTVGAAEETERVARNAGHVSTTAPVPDCVSWACDSTWSSFARPKVAMVGGWGAPGSHLLSERHMRMVSSFAEVVDGEEPLNLQMFHRNDGEAVPVLPTHMKWPLPEFFDTQASATVQAALANVEAKKVLELKTETQKQAKEKPKENPETLNPEARPALPAQGASARVGGVGVPLDMATRLSAQGALTWWHLDDCGEFVFQVGLPVDPETEKRKNAKKDPPRVLLGPNGNPVVKLFIFAKKSDYEWIAQDTVMNRTAKQSALDLFDTPGHYVPGNDELAGPYDAEPLTDCFRDEEKPFKENRDEPDDQQPGEKNTSPTTPHQQPGEKNKTPGSPRLPVFYVAPLEAGGPPLLSPPNLMHCVLTVRDCVMVEERRVSLLFLDEVEYFRKRAAKWCEPPVQYRFVREDLLDPDLCYAGAVLPLLNTFRDAKAKLLEHTVPSGGAVLEEESMIAIETIVQRSINSLTVLCNEANGYALASDTRAAIEVEIAEHNDWVRTRGDAFRAGSSYDDAPRAGANRAATRQMTIEGVGSAHRIHGAHGTSAPTKTCACAVVHERGKPRWGPARATVEETVADRKTMRNAIKDGKLDELLRRYRS